MKNTSDDLFRLIKTLSDKEVRKVRKELGSEATNLSFLFEYMLKGKQYDRKTLLIHHKDRFNRNNLPPTKSVLKTLILEVIRTEHLKAGDRRQMQIRQQFDFIDILCSRGLYQQAYSIIKRVKKEALQEERPYNHFMAISAESVYAANLHGDRTTDALRRIAGELQENKNWIALQIDTYSFYIHIMSYGISSQLFRNYEEYEALYRFEEHPAFKIDVKALSFNLKFQLLDAKALYYELTFRPQKAYHIFKPSWDEIKAKKETLLKGAYQLYMMCMMNYMMYAISAEEWTEVEENLHEYEQNMEHPHFQEPLFLSHYYQSRLNFRYKQKTLHTNSIELMDAEQYYHTHKEQLSLYDHLNYSFDLLRAYMYLGEPQKAYDYGQAILDAPRNSQVRSDVIEYTEVLMMLILLELNGGKPGEYLMNYLNSYYRRKKLAQHKVTYAFEYRIVQFIKYLNKCYTEPDIDTRKAVPEQWTSFCSDINAMINNPRMVYLKRFLDYYDFRPWLERQLEQFTTPPSSSTPTY